MESFWTSSAGFGGQTEALDGGKNRAAHLTLRIERSRRVRHGLSGVDNENGTLSCPGSLLHFTFLDLMVGVRWSTQEAVEGYSDLQASQAVFCFLGGGRVFASS
jgi:hypothetical protein